MSMVDHAIMLILITTWRGVKIILCMAHMTSPQLLRNLGIYKNHHLIFDRTPFVDTDKTTLFQAVYG